MAKPSSTREPSVKRKKGSAETKQGKTRTPAKSRAALVESIAGALVIKDEDIFFLCADNGDLPLQGRHGYGLYYHDCRFLDGYEMRLAGLPLSRLISSAGAGFKAELELTNLDTRLGDGRILSKEDLAVRWERLLDASHLALHDQFTFHNYGMEGCTVPMSLRFAAHFEDVFVVRGQHPHVHGTLHPPRWQDGKLVFAYDGSDGIRRAVTLAFDPAPIRQEDATAHFQIDLPAHGEIKLVVTIALTESKEREEKSPVMGPHDGIQHAEQHLHEKSRQWLDRQTQCHTGNLILNRVLERALLDLHVLRTRLDDLEYFSAGVPWYVTLFGRDGLITALESLAYEPGVAEQTLRLLAHYQGTKVDDWRDEQPGKIMHELRVGELAHDDEIPQTPYYGTVDATPLFLILIGLHAQWVGNLELFKDLRGNVERALQWIDQQGTQHNGFLAYDNKSSKGLSNQGWKDSGDAIVNSDGSLAKPPIALPEVQGYVYLAKSLLADLYRRAGENDWADTLAKDAKALRARFNQSFWMEDKGTYALALQAGSRCADAIASNAGQVLWSGIADEDKARRTMERLMADDMFSGWGIRTLSQNEKRYNAISYHLGTVWPHDNALILAGFRRYRFDRPAAKIFSGIVEAAAKYPMYRLPELFCGFPKQEFGLPVHYPVACHPQAWAAGAVPYMLTAMLGLTPDGFAGRLRVLRPHLPDDCEYVELRRLRVGQASVDVRFALAQQGKVSVKVLRTDGTLEVTTEE
ncbi:MAG TPA: glycogen debranching N-terminal domain-containing protein [Gemmataceae bacterium]|nr:glycogen debranching N-terminal domain-containing protein [Gemmataceae bacterium]